MEVVASQSHPNVCRQDQNAQIPAQCFHSLLEVISQAHPWLLALNISPSMQLACSLPLRISDSDLPSYYDFFRKPSCCGSEDEYIAKLPLIMRLSMTHTTVSPALISSNRSCANV
uniref:Uncharacterized protein n=1 Tax=Triticum urartu TaxID=4572 RepID=A0A8R7R618_TRIUA